MFELVLEIVVTVAVLALYGQGKPRAAAVVTSIEDINLPELFAAADAIMSNPIYDEPEATIEPVVAVAEVLEVTAVVEVDEQVKHQAAHNYAAMSIEELKAEGKRLKVRGYQSWKKPETAISRLEAIAA